MIEVTAKATQLVANHFKDHKQKPIRIFVMLGGCGIRSLGVALEEPTASDLVFEIDGYTYIIDKKVFQQVRPIKVDADGIGFRLSGNGVQPPIGCGNCGNMCGIRGGDRCSGVCATCENYCPHNPSVRRKRRAVKSK